jgi:hypothetical protein
MPLNRGNPHVFRARHQGAFKWFVVDPSADAPALIAEWKSRFAEDNLPTPVRIGRAALGWATFAVVFGAVVAALVAWSPGGWFTPVAVVLGFLGFIAAVMAAIGAFSVTFRSRSHHPNRPLRGVVIIDPSVVRWASDETPIGDLWELAVAVDRVIQVNTALWSWHSGWDAEQGDRPDEIIDDVVGPALRAQEVEIDARLASVSSQLGFEVPRDLLPKWLRDDKARRESASASTR